MYFDVKKHLIKVQGGKDYLPVAYRLVWFREEHPDWGIKTWVLSHDPERGLAVVHAEVCDNTGLLLASGTKMETVRGFSDYLEKAETGAIGRALGVLGYGTQFAPEFEEGDRLADAPQGLDGPVPNERELEIEELYRLAKLAGKNEAETEGGAVKMFGKPIHQLTLDEVKKVVAVMRRLANQALDKEASTQ